MRTSLLLLIPAILTLGGRTAHAKECGPSVAAHLGNAIDIQRALRDYDALRMAGRRTELAGDRGLTNTEPLRFTAVTNLQSNLIAGSTCDGERTLDTVNGDWGLFLSVEDVGRRRKLTLLGLGNLSSAKIDNESESGFVSYGGLAGVRVQLNSWLLLGAANYSSSTNTTVRPGTPPDGHFVEVGIPRWSLLARFLITEQNLKVIPDLQLDDIPLGSDRTGALVLRKVISEGRRIATSTITIPVGQEADMTLDLDAEIALENSPYNLRHARLRLRNTLLDSPPGYTGIGGRVQQQAALSIHRGTLMQEVSQVGTAIGAEYRVSLGLDTKYFYYEFDFGLSYNKPELLDIIPHTANQLEFRLGTTLGKRW